MWQAVQTCRVSGATLATSASITWQLRIVLTFPTRCQLPGIYNTYDSGQPLKVQAISRSDLEVVTGTPSLPFPYG